MGLVRVLEELPRPAGQKHWTVEVDFASSKDVEFAARVAARLNRKLEVVDMDFGGMIPALISGKVDMIGACITITDERKKSVLFSEPYYTGGISALVRE